MLKRVISSVAVIALAVGTVGLVHTGSAFAKKDESPIIVPGNNGTLKVHEFGTESGTESNDPKVCKFNFEGFGFDENQEGYIKIEVQGGSEPIGEDVGPFLVGPANADEYFETEYFNNGGVVVKNGTYKATMYGKDNESGAPDLKDEKAKSKVFKVECAPSEELTPNTSVSAVCLVDEQVVRLTFTNSGTAESTVEVNGDSETVPAGETITVDLPITGPVVNVAVLIDGETVDGVTVTCPTGGSGGETPTTPTTPVTVVVNGGAGEVVSLPVTSGSSDKIAALVTMIGAVLATIGGYVVRMRYAAQL